MIYRVEVQAQNQIDPHGQSVLGQLRQLGCAAEFVRFSRVFLIDTDAAEADVQRIARGLLADPVVETATVNDRGAEAAGTCRIEVHLKPGVMDPVAASTELAIADLGIAVRQVRTGRAYVISPKISEQELSRLASRCLANGVIESVQFARFHPQAFESTRQQAMAVKQVSLCELSDEQLTRLSRDGHLFLSLAEMKAIQGYFQGKKREPTDIELETIAQTWSEHCVHKTLKSTVELEQRDANGRVISTRKYRNLIKETIFDSTQQLMKQRAGDAFYLSVFTDNAGVIAFDERDAVCFKVETHNHPSAIEPYGGSATGAGGVIRDILGTGLAARPIAATDVFCVADPKYSQPLPRGVIHPRRILEQVVAGVRDYGNRMGIPTVNGAVYFDDHYLGNPLVFCGCVGLIPRDRIRKQPQVGDVIVVMGGRTGRDGIHGATFSSAELTDTHADEFSHAVQIGNAITEKKMADVILAARDRELFTAVTDCGAGGLSSAIGEMGEKTGAVVELDRVPLKYLGLRYDEIWISEAQERMVLSVPREKLAELLALARSEDVETTDIGVFGTPGRELVLRHGGREVGRMGMEFLHDGIPMPTRKAVVIDQPKSPAKADQTLIAADFSGRLLATLAQPNIASKHWIIRQYDHEVQGSSVIKPLTGPKQVGPSDAAVLRPTLSTHRGIALGCGMAPSIEDPYEMTLAAIDEAIRNVVAVGADLKSTAILDNFCWPSVDDEITMGTLVRACEACRDAALAYGVAFISGKDSLHNQFTNQETKQVLRIPRTLLISAISVLPDVRNCLTMDLKCDGGSVYLVESAGKDAQSLAKFHTSMSAVIASGDVVACHDVSDGGIAVALAEMCIASGVGVKADANVLLRESAFADTPGRYLLQIARGADAGAISATLAGAGKVTALADLQTGSSAKATLVFAGSAVEIDALTIDALTKAWRGTLDW